MSVLYRVRMSDNGFYLEEDQNGRLFASSDPATPREIGEAEVLRRKAVEVYVERYKHKLNFVLEPEKEACF